MSDHNYGLATRNQFLEDPSQVFSQPGFAAIKDITESQFGRAQENIIANTPEGGGLTQALGDLEAARASDLVRGTANLNESELPIHKQMVW